MTNRQLLEKIISEMSNEELAEFVINTDLKNMAVLDNTIFGENDKDKIVNFLQEEAEVV